jgi:hypothetical protein
MLRDTATSIEHPHLKLLCPLNNTQTFVVLSFCLWILNKLIVTLSLLFLALLLFLFVVVVVVFLRFL